MVKPVEWNGIRYGSIKEAAYANGLKFHTLRYRISRGYRSDSEMPKNCEIIFRNKIYASIREAAEKTFYSKEYVRRLVRASRKNY